MVVNAKKNFIMEATEIIDNVLKAVGLNAPTFAKTIGVNYQRIFDLQRGRTKKFHPEIVKGILNQWPNINVNYLYTGEGDVMLKPGQSVPQGSIEEMVNDVVTKYMESDECKTRIKYLDDRESAINKRENMLAEREEKVTTMYSDLIARDKEIREKEAKLSELERSIMERELKLELDKKK